MAIGEAPGLAKPEVAADLLIGLTVRQAMPGISRETRTRIGRSEKPRENLSPAMSGEKCDQGYRWRPGNRN